MALLRKSSNSRLNNLKDGSLRSQRVWVAASIIWQLSRGLNFVSLAGERYARTKAVVVMDAVMKLFTSSACRLYLFRLHVPGHRTNGGKCANRRPLRCRPGLFGRRIGTQVRPESSGEEYLKLLEADSSDVLLLEKSSSEVLVIRLLV